MRPLGLSRLIATLMDPSTSTKADKEWGWANNLAPHTPMIYVLNKKTYDHATASVWIDPSRIIYVGRPSPLGNPHAVEPYRCSECLKYHKQGEGVTAFKLELNDSYCAYKRGYINGPWKSVLDLAKRIKAEPDEAWGLMCWCAPKACHADAIKEAIEWIFKKGLV